MEGPRGRFYFFSAFHSASLSVGFAEVSCRGLWKEECVGACCIRIRRENRAIGSSMEECMKRRGRGNMKRREWREMNAGS